MGERLLGLADRLLRWHYDSGVRRALRMAEIPEPEIEHFFLERGKLEFVIRHPLFTQFGTMLGEIYEEFGGKNFLEVQLVGPKRVYVVTIAPRESGVKPPGEVVAELKARIAELEAAP